MLPVVRRKAEAGDGHALLRWLELDPAPATAFMLQEVVRPTPRFSSTYLRLPDRSLPAEQQRQIAANFVTLKSAGGTDALGDLAASLHDAGHTAPRAPIYRPASGRLALQGADPGAGLSAQGFAWPGSTARGASPSGEGPIVLSARAVLPEPGLYAGLSGAASSGCQASRRGNAVAEDAAEYLRRYGSASMKPFVWQQLSRWHKKYAESGAEARVATGKFTQDDYYVYRLYGRLFDAFVAAHAWMLSPSDVDKLSNLVGKKRRRRGRLHDSVAAVKSASGRRQEIPDLRPCSGPGIFS